MYNEQQEKEGKDNSEFQEFYDKHKELEKLNNDFFKSLQTPEPEPPMKSTLEELEPAKPITNLNLPTITLDTNTNETLVTGSSLKITEI
jgi:hypothetical protein